MRSRCLSLKPMFGLGRADEGLPATSKNSAYGLSLASDETLVELAVAGGLEPPTTGLTIRRSTN